MASNDGFGMGRPDLWEPPGAKEARYAATPRPTGGPAAIPAPQGPDPRTFTSNTAKFQALGRGLGAMGMDPAAANPSALESLPPGPRAATPLPDGQGGMGNKMSEALRYGPGGRMAGPITDAELTARQVRGLGRAIDAFHGVEPAPRYSPIANYPLSRLPAEPPAPAPAGGAGPRWSAPTANDVRYDSIRRPTWTEPTYAAHPNAPAPAPAPQPQAATPRPAGGLPGYAVEEIPFDEGARMSAGEAPAPKPAAQPRTPPYAGMSSEAALEANAVKLRAAGNAPIRPDMGGFGVNPQPHEAPPGARPLYSGKMGHELGYGPQPSMASRAGAGLAESARGAMAWAAPVLAAKQVSDAGLQAMRDNPAKESAPMQPWMLNAKGEVAGPFSSGGEVDAIAGASQPPGAYKQDKQAEQKQTPPTAATDAAAGNSKPAEAAKPETPALAAPAAGQGGESAPAPAPQPQAPLPPPPYGYALDKHSGTRYDVAPDMDNQPVLSKSVLGHNVPMGGNFSVLDNSEGRAVHERLAAQRGGYGAGVQAPAAPAMPEAPNSWAMDKAAWNASVGKDHGERAIYAGMLAKQQAALGAQAQGAVEGVKGGYGLAQQGMQNQAAMYGADAQAQATAEAARTQGGYGLLGKQIEAQGRVDAAAARPRPEHYNVTQEQFDTGDTGKDGKPVTKPIPVIYKNGVRQPNQYEQGLVHERARTEAINHLTPHFFSGTNPAVTGPLDWLMTSSPTPEDIAAEEQRRYEGLMAKYGFATGGAGAGPQAGPNGEPVQVEEGTGYRFFIDRNGVKQYYQGQ